MERIEIRLTGPLGEVLSELLRTIENLSREVEGLISSFTLEAPLLSSVANTVKEWGRDLNEVIKYYTELQKRTTEETPTGEQPPEQIDDTLISKLENFKREISTKTQGILQQLSDLSQKVESGETTVKFIEPEGVIPPLSKLRTHFSTLEKVVNDIVEFAKKKKSTQPTQPTQPTPPELPPSPLPLPSMFQPTILPSPFLIGALSPEERAEYEEEFRKGLDHLRKIWSVVYEAIRVKAKKAFPFLSSVFEKISNGGLYPDPSMTIGITLDLTIVIGAEFFLKHIQFVPQIANVTEGYPNGIEDIVRKAIEEHERYLKMKRGELPPEELEGKEPPKPYPIAFWKEIQKLPVPDVRSTDIRMLTASGEGLSQITTQPTPGGISSSDVVNILKGYSIDYLTSLYAKHEVMHFLMGHLNIAPEALRRKFEGVAKKHWNTKVKPRLEEKLKEQARSLGYDESKVKIYEWDQLGEKFKESIWIKLTNVAGDMIINYIWKEWEEGRTEAGRLKFTDYEKFYVEREEKIHEIVSDFYRRALEGLPLPDMLVGGVSYAALMEAKKGGKKEGEEKEEGEGKFVTPERYGVDPSIMKDRQQRPKGLSELLNDPEFERALERILKEMLDSVDIDLGHDGGGGDGNDYDIGELPPIPGKGRGKPKDEEGEGEGEGEGEEGERKGERPREKGWGTRAGGKIRVPTPDTETGRTQKDIEEEHGKDPYAVSPNKGKHPDEVRERTKGDWNVARKALEDAIRRGEFGSLPDGVKRMIESILKEGEGYKVDEVLKIIIGEMVYEAETELQGVWRSLGIEGRDPYHTYREKYGPVIYVVVDTSGSITQQEFTKFVRTIRDIARGAQADVYVVPGDVVPYGIFHIGTGDEAIRKLEKLMKEGKLRGGGGTDMMGIVRHIANLILMTNNQPLLTPGMEDDLKEWVKRMKREREGMREQGLEMVVEETYPLGGILVLTDGYTDAPNPEELRELKKMGIVVQFVYTDNEIPEGTEDWVVRYNRTTDKIERKKGSSPTTRMRMKKGVDLKGMFWDMFLRELERRWLRG